VDVSAIAVRGHWIRHAPHRSQLLGPSVEAIDGRWQRAGVVRALYLADEPQTAIAEWYRWLAERGLRPERSVPHDHHVWSVDLELANLSDSQRLASSTSPHPYPCAAAGRHFRSSAKSCGAPAG